MRVAATAAEKKVRLVMARGWAATSSPGEEEARTATATRRDAERLRVAEAPEIAAGMVEDIADIVVASTVRRVLARPASSPMLSWRVSDEARSEVVVVFDIYDKSRHTRAFWEPEVRAGGWGVAADHERTPLRRNPTPESGGMEASSRQPPRTTRSLDAGALADDGSTPLIVPPRPCPGVRVARQRPPARP